MHGACGLRASSVVLAILLVGEFPVQSFSSFLGHSGYFVCLGVEEVKDKPETLYLDWLFEFFRM